MFLKKKKGDEHRAEQSQHSEKPCPLMHRKNVSEGQFLDSQEVLGSSCIVENLSFNITHELLEGVPS